MELKGVELAQRSTHYMINYDKEYHPVIEDYICDYAEGRMDETEKRAFEEVLEKDEELKELAEHAQKGRELALKLFNTAPNPRFFLKRT